MELASITDQTVVNRKRNRRRTGRLTALGCGKCEQKRRLSRTILSSSHEGALQPVAHGLTRLRWST